VLFLAHPESDNLVLGLLSGILGAEVELKLGNESVVVVEPDRNILGVRVDNGRFKPTKGITSQIGDHIIDLLVIPDKCRGAILEVEDALEEKGAELLGILPIEGVRVPDSGPRLFRSGRISLFKSISDTLPNDLGHCAHEVRRGPFIGRSRTPRGARTSTSTSIATIATAAASAGPRIWKGYTMFVEEGIVAARSLTPIR
jgi:hypothetical protein